eukprot:m.70665 g.70665  ORF g.70665 m.70665 type:complete len:159 (+) comp16850_c0_seq2:740-1216(+)
MEHPELPDDVQRWLLHPPPLALVPRAFFTLSSAAYRAMPYPARPAAPFPPPSAGAEDDEEEELELELSEEFKAFLATSAAHRKQRQAQQAQERAEARRERRKAQRERAQERKKQAAETKLAEAQQKHDEEHSEAEQSETGSERLKDHTAECSSSVLPE